MPKKIYSNEEKILFYEDKIKSLKAKIASEERELYRDPKYPTERLFAKLDLMIEMLSKLKER